MADFEDLLVERLGVSLTNSERQRSNLMLAIELRNVISHNRGVVSETTVRRLEAYEHGRQVVPGKRFHVDFDDLADLANCLLEIARSVDEAFCAKFRIRRTRFKAAPRKRPQP